MARAGSSRTSIRGILRTSLVLVVVVPFLPLGVLAVRSHVDVELLWSVGFAVVAAVAIFLWTSRRLALPVEHIRSALLRVGRTAAAPLRVAEDVTGVAEYAALVEAFDGLTARLAATERELIHAEKTALLGQLASGIAHEIGTPLNVMSGYAQVLRRRIPDDPEVVAAADKIVKQTERLAEMVRRILDFARPDPASMAPVALGEVIHHALEMAHALTRSVHLEVEHNPRTPEVLGQARLLEHVLLNLVVNAVHACEERRDDARIEISTGLLAGQRAALSGEPWVFCRVHDNGVGIPPENLGKIFAPFFTTKSQGHGTGLGLAIVERIVRQHGGEIEVESRPGKGTTFTLLLPRAPDPAARDAGGRFAGDAGEPPRPADAAAGDEPAGAAPGAGTTAAAASAGDATVAPDGSPPTAAR